MPTKTLEPVSAPARKNAAHILKIAANPVRLAILSHLEAGDKFVNELCDLLDMTQPGVSHHLALMRLKNIIEARRSGKRTYYTLSALGQKTMKAVRSLA